MPDNMDGFSKRLMKRMMEMRMSQADLCRSTGLATSMVSHYCTGQRIPSVQVAGKIAKSLDTSIDALVFGKPDKTRKTAGALNEPAVSEAKKAYLSSKMAQEQACDDYDLLAMFHSLSMEGQEKVLAYIDDLQLTRKYRASKK